MGQNMLFEAHLIIHFMFKGILYNRTHGSKHAFWGSPHNTRMYSNVSCSSVHAWKLHEILALKQSLLTLFNSTYAYVFLFLRSLNASIQDLFMPFMIPRMVIGMKWLQVMHSCIECFKHFKSWSTRASNVWNILWGFHAWNQNEMITLEVPMLQMFLFTFLACSYQWFQSLNHPNLMTVRHSCNYIEFMLKSISSVWLEFHHPHGVLRL